MQPVGRRGFGCHRFAKHGLLIIDKPEHSGVACRRTLMATHPWRHAVDDSHVPKVVIVVVPADRRHAVDGNLAIVNGGCDRASTARAERHIPPKLGAALLAIPWHFLVWAREGCSASRAEFVLIARRPTAVRARGTRGNTSIQAHAAAPAENIRRAALLAAIRAVRREFNRHHALHSTCPIRAALPFATMLPANTCARHR